MLAVISPVGPCREGGNSPFLCLPACAHRLLGGFMGPGPIYLQCQLSPFGGMMYIPYLSVSISSATVTYRIPPCFPLHGEFSGVLAQVSCSWKQWVTLCHPSCQDRDTAAQMHRMLPPATLVPRIWATVLLKVVSAPAETRPWPCWVAAPSPFLGCEEHMGPQLQGVWDVTWKMMKSHRHGPCPQ